MTKKRIVYEVRYTDETGYPVKAGEYLYLGEAKQHQQRIETRSPGLAVWIEEVTYN